MCGHKQIGIWEISKITVVDSNDKNRGNVDAPVINQSFTTLLLSSQMPNCLCPHIPYIPK